MLLLLVRSVSDKVSASVDVCLVCVCVCVCVIVHQHKCSMLCALFLMFESDSCVDIGVRSVSVYSHLLAV